MTPEIRAHSASTVGAAKPVSGEKSSTRLLLTPRWETDTELFEHHMRVNQLGCLLGMKTVVPLKCTWLVNTGVVYQTV